MKTHKAPRRHRGRGAFWVNISSKRHYGELALNVLCIAFFLYVAMQFVLTIPKAL